MHLKKCAGCARAIVKTAAVCQYCGHVLMDPGASQPDLGFDADEGQMTFEGQVRQDERRLRESLDTVDANEKPVDAWHPQPELTSAGLPEPGEPVLAPILFEETPIEAVAGEPSPDNRVFDRLQEEAGGRDGGAGSAPEDQFAFLRDDENAAADYDIEEALAPTPAPAADQPHPAATPAAAAGPVRKPQMRALAMGAAAAGILILGILSMRGAASPGAAAAVPSAPPKPKAAPAAKSAAAPANAQAAATRPAVTQSVKTQSAPGAQSALASAPSWSRVTDGRWVGRDRRAIALELEAIGKVPVWMRQVRPVLVLRCTSGAAEVFVYTQTAAKMEPQDENHTVRVRVDDGQEVTQRWADSLEHDALFAPDGTALAQQLMRARMLRFGFTPHNAAPVVAEFEVTGLADLLAPSSRQCGWKK
jgi:hypothetical protein